MRNVQLLRSLPAIFPSKHCQEHYNLSVNRRRVGFGVPFFNGVDRRAEEVWSPCGGQFGEESGEILFSILAVEEQFSSASCPPIPCSRSENQQPTAATKDEDASDFEVLFRCVAISSHLDGCPCISVLLIDI